MIRTLTGTTISYGASLPVNVEAPDGALFFKTTADAGGEPGLYVYNFKQDFNTAVIGDQVGLSWKQASSLKNYVELEGTNRMTGSLHVGGALIPSGASGIGGVVVDISLDNNPGTVKFVNGSGGTVGSIGWNTATSQMLVSGNWTFTSAPSVSGGATIWSSGNDGAGSGLDADLLDGQHGSYYTNLVNSSGNLDINSRTTNTLLVTRGGTGATSVTQGGIVFGSTTAQYGSTLAGVAGQILQSSGAGTPVWVNQNSIAAGTAIAADSGYFNASAVTPRLELHKPGVIAGMWYINSSNLLALAQTNGAGVVTADRLTIDPANGNFSTTGSIYSATGISTAGDVVAYASDARLKKNITVIKNAVDKVAQLGGYEYDWDLEKTRRLGFAPRSSHEHGLLAQEVQKVMPDAVVPAPFNVEYLTVKYERLVALLVAAVNEQQTQINELKETVSRLTS